MIPRHFKDRAAQLSPTSARFLDFVEREPDLSRPIDVTGFHTDYPVQCWPTFISSAQQQEIERATTSVFKLLRSIPDKIFGNDIAKITDYYQIRPPQLASMLLTPPNGLDIAIGRADLIDSESGFKCVEFNPFGSLGGLETEFMLDIYQHSHAYSRFVAASGIEPKPQRCMLKLFEHVIRVTLDSGIASDTVNVAVVSDGGQPAFAGCKDLPDAVFHEALANVGGAARGTLVRCGAEDIQERNGDLYCGEVRLHAVWEYLRRKFYPARFVLAFKRGRISYFNTAVSGYFGSKRNLALLSQALDSDLYDEDDRDAISRYIPWTREVADREVVFRERRDGLPGLLRSHQHELVLKKGQGYGGDQVFMGESTSAAQWEEAIRMALDEGDWIAQEFFKPRTFVYQWGDEGYAPCKAIWGGFCFGDVFGGTYLRILPDEHEGPINSARGAMTGLVFEA
jgi:hypothetical protein